MECEGFNTFLFTKTRGVKYGGAFLSCGVRVLIYLISVVI